MQDLNLTLDLTIHLLYHALDHYQVTKSVVKHDMSKGGHYFTDIFYSFGPYTIKFRKQTPELKNTSNIINIYEHTYERRNPLDFRNKKLPTKQYVYDLYCAAKNKYEGKPYVNPYNIIQNDLYQLVTEHIK